MASITPKIENEMLTLKARGWSYNRIGRWLHVSPTSVLRHLDSTAKERSTKACNEYSRTHAEGILSYNRKVRTDVLAFLGGKCSNCGEAGWRVLVINHINGDHARDKERYGKSGHSFYKAIVNRTRNTDDLNLLCANCNILYEYQVGKRKGTGRERISENVKLQRQVVILLGGKCSRCGISDARILTINHLHGGGVAELKRLTNRVFYRMILAGERTTEDLNVLCVNCNTVHDYECGQSRRGKHNVSTPA